MPLTNREKKILAEIKEWESMLINYEANDLELTCEKYMESAFSLLPEKIQDQFFSMVDGWLFHLHALVQGSQLQLDAKERILASGRIFQSEINQVVDLKNLEIDKLQYIAHQQIARHRLYSFAQGGLSGTGGVLLLGADIPAMAAINLRVIQLIAMTYGVEVNTPYEMMTSLKVFHTSTLPTRLQGSGWKVLLADLRSREDRYFYEGNEELTDISWLNQPMQHILKAMVIAIFRKKMIQGIPFVSMAVGAGSNYVLTRKVTEFAHKYYQLRYLMEREEKES